MCRSFRFGVGSQSGEEIAGRQLRWWYCLDHRIGGADGFTSSPPACAGRAHRCGMSQKVVVSMCIMFRGGEQHLAATFLVLLLIKNAVWGHNNLLCQAFFPFTFIPCPSNCIFCRSEMKFLRFAFQKVDKNLFFSGSAAEQQKSMIATAAMMRTLRSHCNQWHWESRETQNKNSNLKGKETKWKETKRDPTQLP